MSSSICIRLPDETVKELESLASALDRTKTYLINKALENYLQEYADYLIALERLNDKDDKIISGRKIRDELGL